MGSLYLLFSFYFFLFVAVALFGRKAFSAPVHVSHLMWKNESDKWNRRSSPSHDDEEIQPVPRVSEVTASTEDPQSNHLYNHLQSEEDVDECIKGLTEMKQRYTVLMRKNRKMSFLTAFEVIQLTAP